MSSPPSSSNQQSAILVRVYIIRHGETDENRKGIIQGQLDTSLNEEGRLQAERVAEALRDLPVKFERAWTSDLGRAVAVRFHPLMRTRVKYSFVCMCGYFCDAHHGA